MLKRLRNFRTNENILIAVDALVRSKSSFLTIFLMTYMIRISLDNSPADYIVYNIITFVCMGTLPLIILRFLKKHTLLAWRIGMLFAILQVLVIVTMHGQTEFFPYVLALVTGIESTLYWRPNSYFMITEVRNDRRLRFQSIRQTISEIIRVIMPIILGLLITDAGYIHAAILVLIISVVQFFLSILFRPSKPVKRPSLHRADIIFRKIVNSRSLRRTIYLQFFRGLLSSDTAFLVVPTLMVYSYTNSDLDLGLYASIGAILCIAAILLYHKVLRRRRHANIFLIIIAALTILLSSATIIWPSLITSIVLYVFVIGMISGFTNMFLVSRIQGSLKKHLDNSFTVEVEAVSELFICAARIASFIALLYIVSMGDKTYLTYFLAANALLMIPMLYLARVRKKVDRPEQVPPRPLD